MVAADDEAIKGSIAKELRGSIRGEILLPDENGYDQARKVWNGMIDRQPAVIVRCRGASDVMKAVRFARQHELVVSVRGGGHNVTGNAVNDNGMMIDLSNMKSVRVDPVERTACVEPGATWREFDLEAQAFGLATTGGLVSSTGVAGFTLGGGIGWLVRKYGLSLDNLTSVDLVTAEGEIVSANMNENADLFWGLRGGGGNFGIVTSFEFQLHPVGPMVMGGMVLHRASDAEELLRFFRDFANSIPDDLTSLIVFLTAPPLPFIPSELVGTHMVAVAVCYAGPVDEGRQVLEPLKKFGRPVADLIEEMPYVFLQSFLDDTAPPGIRNYWKTAYLKALDDETIKTYLKFGERIPSPISSVHIHHLGGKIRDVEDGATAFSNRDAAFALNIVSGWQEAGDDDMNIRWSRDFFNEMQKFSTGAAYLNFLGEEGQERVMAAYGKEKYEKLAALKKKYDPTNFFHLNQNIKPAP
ncbi:MAG TPA: FAD-binding oxidoreductase [Methanomassiliicoccales archaeon]|jgi:hypothetical protein